MKFIKQIIMTILLLVVPVSGLAFQNEPIGFRDLYWGETLEEVKQGREVEYFNYDEKTNSVTYWVHLNSDESKTLSQVPILREGFDATFWNDKLWKIILYFNGKSTFTSLKNAMIQLYGKPQINEWDNCIWIGKNTIIDIANDSAAGGAWISIGSTKLLYDLIKEQASQGW